MSLTEAESDVVADVTQAFMNDFTGVSPVVEAPEGTEVPANDPAIDDTAEAVAEAPSFEYDPEVPEDILAELNEAEIDDEVAQEMSSRVTEEDEYGVVEDEDAVRERLKLTKRNAYLEKELAKSKSGSWKDEALKYFPLSKHSLDSIDATSRRSFLRQAKDEHERILPHVQSVLSEAKTFVDAEKAAARAEGKTAAAEAFGKPLSGPDVNEIDQASANSNLTLAREEAKKTGSLVNVFKRLMEAGN
jgi:hypothetical protein